VALILHGLAAVTPAGTQIPVSEYPNYLAVAGGSLYADFGGGQTVTPVSIATGKPGSPIYVGKEPDALAVAGRTLYVANYGSNSVTPISIATGDQARRSPLEASRVRWPSPGAPCT
jgi:DNA-binding beta-propeller fold protein YncE